MKSFIALKTNFLPAKKKKMCSSFVVGNIYTLKEDLFTSYNKKNLKLFGLVHVKRKKLLCDW